MQNDSKSIKNRSEILFIYDCKWSNPNGDPIDENKPRIDEETGINYVTDVRLKRTIRDYIDEFKRGEIFIKEIRKDDGKLKTKEDLLEDYKIQTAKDLLNYVDIRLFGSTAAVKGKSIVYTGPVQFNFGRSLHKVSLEFVKGTTVMPSKESKGQGTFTENYVLPYSLVAFYGIVNENVSQQMDLTQTDVDLLMEAIWNGTKNLITRSKFGQTPRLLLQIEYKEDQNGFYIGDLLGKVSIQNKDGKIDEGLRDIEDYSINLDKLADAINSERSKINTIKYKSDENFVKLDGIGIDQSIELSEFTF